MAENKKMTNARIAKRNKVADAIKRENPGISDEKKFRMATATVKRGMQKRKMGRGR